MVIAVVAVVLVVALWQPVAVFLARQAGYDLTAPVETETPAEVAAADTVTPDADPAAEVTGRAVGVEDGQPVTLGSPAAGDGQYALGLEISPVGAGVAGVTLNDYRATVDGAEPYVFETADAGALPESHPLRTRALILDGERIDLGGVTWELSETTPTAATYAVTVNGDAGEPAARVTKTYTVTPRAADGAGYEVLVRHEVQNLTDAPQTARLILNGPTTPPAELEDRPDRQVIAAYFVDGEPVVEQHIVQSVSPGEQITLGAGYAEETFAWAGTSTIYFQALVRPDLTPQQREEKVIPQPFADVTLSVVNPEEEVARNRQVALTFETRATTIQPGGSFALPLRVFFGPKERALLKGAYYDGPVTRFGESLVAPVGCTICVFQPIVDVLNQILRLFHALTGDWGLAIIGLVIVVKALLHPIVKRGQLSMMIAGKRMQRIAPQLKKLKEKYGDDQAGYAKAAMQLQRENMDVKQFLGCLPMLLQSPIWIALYQSLQTTFELRHAPFLYGFTWIDDLSKPDHLVDFGQSYGLPCLFFSPSISGINLLPLLLGVVFYINMRLQPQPTQALSPEQEQQQKLMKIIFPLVFPIFLYSAPSGLNLYILTSTFIGIIETKLVRRTFKLKEAAIDAEPIREPTDPPPAAEPVTVKPGRRGGGGAAAAEKKGGLGRLLGEPPGPGRTATAGGRGEEEGAGQATPPGQASASTLDLGAAHGQCSDTASPILSVPPLANTVGSGRQGMSTRRSTDAHGRTVNNSRPTKRTCHRPVSTPPSGPPPARPLSCAVAAPGVGR